MVPNRGRGAQPARSGKGSGKTDLGAELAEAVNADALFNGNDDEKSQELFKLLTAAGMDCNIDFADGQLVENLQSVLSNFDPNEKKSEEDSAFKAKMIKYKHHAAKKQLRTDRAGKMEKKVDAKYLAGVSNNNNSSGPKMSTEERRVHQLANTEFLRTHMEDIKRLNNIERAKATLPLLTVTGAMAIDKIVDVK